MLSSGVNGIRPADAKACEKRKARHTARERERKREGKKEKERATFCVSTFEKGSAASL